MGFRADWQGLLTFCWRTSRRRCCATTRTWRRGSRGCAATCSCTTGIQRRLADSSYFASSTPSRYYASQDGVQQSRRWRPTVSLRGWSCRTAGSTSATSVSSSCASPSTELSVSDRSQKCADACCQSTSAPSVPKSAALGATPWPLRLTTCQSPNSAAGATTKSASAWPTCGSPSATTNSGASKASAADAAGAAARTTDPAPFAGTRPSALAKKRFHVRGCGTHTAVNIKGKIAFFVCLPDRAAAEHRRDRCGICPK